MNTNIKRFLGYFLYIVFIGLVLYWGSVYGRHIEEQVARTFGTKPIILYNVSFPIGIGMLLALPRFIRTVIKPGKLHVDWIKLFAVGLPTLYVTLFIPIYFSPLGNLLPRWFFQLGRELLNFSELPIIFGIIFGYALLTSAKKKD